MGPFKSMVLYFCRDFLAFVKFKIFFSLSLSLSLSDICFKETIDWLLLQYDDSQQCLNETHSRPGSGGGTVVHQQEAAIRRTNIQVYFTFKYFSMWTL